MTPALEAWMDGARVARLEAPAQIAPRDWILGVLAVQFDVEKGKVVARLRGNVTGAEEPAVVELVPPAVVHITLVEGATPALPPIGSPTSHEAVEQLAILAAQKFRDRMVAARVRKVSREQLHPAAGTFPHAVILA